MNIRKSFTIIFSLIVCVQAIYGQSRLDSIRTKSVSSPTADTIYRGNDYTYQGSSIKKLTNFSIKDGIKTLISSTEYDKVVDTYTSCYGLYASNGNLLRYVCEYDSVVTGLNARCSKSFVVENQSFKLNQFSLNFKTKDFNGNVLVDSISFLKPETLAHDFSTAFCYQYDNKNNVIELITKTIEGTTTFYGDKREYEIKYDALGRKEKEIITWTYILIKRTVDSIAYTYQGDESKEFKYLTFQAGATNPSDLTITTKGINGIKNIQIFKNNVSTSNLYLSSNADYYYSQTSSLEFVEKINQFKIFPNPAMDYIYIESNKAVKYRIQNIQGQLQTNGQLLTNEPIDIQHLLPGIYIIDIDAGMGFHTSQKFVKI